MNTSEKTSGLTSKQNRIKFGVAQKPLEATSVLFYAMAHAFGGLTAYVLMVINENKGTRTSANLYNAGKDDGIGARFGRGFTAEGSLVTPLGSKEDTAALGKGNKKKPYVKMSAEQIKTLTEGCVVLVPIKEAKPKPSAKVEETAPAA